MSSAESLKLILAKKFQDYGGESATTKLFENLAKPAQEQLLQAAALVPGEIPVLASIVDTEHWVLITTKRLVVFQSGKLVNVDVDVIAKCETDIFKRAETTGPAPRGDLALIEKLKEQAEVIGLTLASGETYSLRVESGAPYFGILNVLMHLASRHHVRRALAAREGLR